MWVNNYPHYRYKLYFNKNIKLMITSFFNTFSLLFNALLPSLHKFLYALKKKNVFGWAASHACTASFARNTGATIFEFLYPFVDTPLRENTVPVLCWKSSMDFGPWYNFRPQKKNGSLSTALPWCQRKLERPWLTLRLGQRNWPSNFKPAQLWWKKKPRLAMHAKTTVLPTETQMQLHCR